jgi:peptidyl-prolyl cis-trans isomerase D
MNDVHDAIEDARAGGATLAEIGQKRGIAAITLTDVDAAGKTPDGKSPDVANLTEIVRAGYQSDVGTDNDPIQLGDNGYIWYAVTKIDPARDRSFAEAKADVLKAWRGEETRKRLQAKADEWVKALNAGKTTLQQVATEAHASISAAIGLTRLGREMPKDLGPGAIASAFAAPPGGFGSADASQSPGRVVFQVTKASVPTLDPASGERKELDTALGQTLQGDLATEYVLTLQNEYGVRVNPTALASVTGGTQTD